MKRIVLLWIILFAFILRMYRISDVPPALSLDEVSIGYNAYSILQTGADEYGTKLPLLLRAYDDWRPAFYVYLVVPSIQLFGLTSFGVRLPSVLLGTATVLLTYFLVRELFSYNRYKNYNSYIGSLSALLLAISPWHIYLSRLSHEVNFGLFLIILGVYSLFHAVGNKKHSWSMVVSAAAFGLSLNSYQSEKIITPVLVMALGILFWRQLLLNKKQLLISFSLGLIIAIAILFTSLQPEALIRLRATSAFQPNQRKVEMVKTFIASYTSHFRLSWLFSGGPRESHKVPGLGLLYPWEAPLVALGLFWFVRSSLSWRIKALLMIWLLSTPIPAAITTQAPHAMRSFTFLPVWQILGAAGFVTLWKKQNMYAWGLLGLLTLVSVGYFMKQYFGVFPRTQSDSFQYALTKAIPVVLKQESEYERIVFSNSKNLYQSYMFFLFYSRYDPAAYQKEGGTFSGGFAETHKIGIYEFRPIIWNKEKIDRKTLYVGNPEEIPENAHVVDTVSHLDGTPAIVLASRI